MIPSITSIQSGFPMLSFFILAAAYVFFSYCLIAIARKTGQEKISWWAWVPIMQVLLILKIASIEWWWIFFFLIPFVNIAVAIYVWIKVARSLSRHPIWGILMVVPVLDLFVLAYLAFSKPKTV